jgi:oligopeptide transport system substrate-binding protein
MKTSKLKNLCAVALAATLGLSVLTGCGSKTEDKAGAGAAASKQEMTYNLGADPKTLDPGLNASVDGGIVVENLFEGLAKLDAKNKAIEGQAEKWEVSADGLTYTFKLKKDLKWSNGDPVKASDFVYAWKRVINPDTAAEYAYQMYYIKGAEAANTGKGSMDAVGVKATDDTTLVVTLEAPCSYFLELTAFPCYFPLDEKAVGGNNEWANDAKTYVSNGPFKMTDYKIKDQIVLEKNENYEAKNDVKLDKLTMKLIAEETSAWASYKSGQFDMVDIVPLSEIQGAVKDKSATTFPNLGTNFISVNVSDKAKEVDPNAAKALSDPKVRKALGLAIDRQAIVDNVTKAGQIPAHSYVPEGITGADGKDFASKNYFEPKGDVEQAKKLLAEAGFPDGKGLPTLTLLYNAGNGNNELMQAVQDMWKKVGINVELQTQEWKVFQNTRIAKQFVIARDAWLADYTDPMTFLDMFLSNSQNNNAGYNNPKFDKAIQDAKKETDANKRLTIMHQAEDMLMEDMPVIPIYYYTQTKGIKDYVKDVRVSPLGFVYFDKAHIEGKK